jgi:dihydrofolate reductase
MRKVIASPFTSLDGFMSGPHGELEWNVSYFDEEMEALVNEQLENADTLLFGRVTYQRFAQYWPTAGVKDDPGHAAKMNSLPKSSSQRRWKRQHGTIHASSGTTLSRRLLGSNSGEGRTWC